MDQSSYSAPCQYYGYNRPSWAYDPNKEAAHQLQHYSRYGSNASPLRVGSPYVGMYYQDSSRHMWMWLLLVAAIIAVVMFLRRR